MGHGKETPRQKMIGMMYLVLTALLALNVSKEVLNAFIIVDEGLHTTNESFQSKIDYIYNEIDKQALIKEEQAKPVQEAAKDAREWAREVYSHIEQLKKEMIMEIDGVDEAAADTLAKKIKNVKSSDNYDDPTRILLGTDVSQIAQSKARELRNMLDEYRENMKGLFDREGIDLIDEATVLENMGDLGIDTKDNPDGKDPEDKHWEYKKFYHTPLWATLSILTQIQSEVLNAESIIAEKLLSSIGSGDFKFNLLETKVIPNSNYVIKGENYSAEVFLAAFDTITEPTIMVGEYEGNDQDGYRMVGDYETLPIDGGKGIYEKKGTVRGAKSWGGLISLTAPDGTVKNYPFSASYEVAEANLVVSPTKVNVFYMGLENPVEISVPGYSPSDVTANINNGTIRKDRAVGYVVKPQKPGDAVITVYGESEGKRKSLGTKEFRVFPLPPPVAKVAGKSSGQIRKSVLLAQSGVIAEMENFLFNVRYRVTEFTVSTTVQGYTVDKKTKGNRFTRDQLDLIRDAKRGSKIYIEDITAVGPDNIPRKLGTIALKIQ